MTVQSSRRWVEPITKHSAPPRSSGATSLDLADGAGQRGQTVRTLTGRGPHHHRALGGGKPGTP